MAKKPIRIYKRSTATANGVEPVQIYKSGHQDRMSITQQVIQHSSSHLRRTEAAGRYEALLHSIYDAVLITDQEGNILEVNTRCESAFLLNHEQLSEMNIVDLISGADAELLRVVRKNVTNKKFTVLEAVGVRGDESRFYAEIVVNRMDSDGEKQLCFFVRDVTARKQAEEELRNANDKLLEAEKAQARVDTLSTLFYELNNPLQILTCMADLDENKEYKKQISRIVDVLEELQKQEAIEPIVDEDGNTRFDVAAAHPDLMACDSQKVLVVDDERMLREMFERAIHQSFPGLTIYAASDGSEATDLFRQQRPALVIMDVSMPVMTGEEAFDAIAEICEQEGWQVPQVVFCTGFVVSDRLREIVGDGKRHACLSKPLTIGDLVEMVRGRLAVQEAGVVS